MSNQYFAPFQSHAMMAYASQHSNNLFQKPKVPDSLIEFDMSEMPWTLGTLTTGRAFLVCRTDSHP
jgi:hypothetical protein